MRKHDAAPTNQDDAGVEALAQIEALQAAVADAEARSATAQGQLAELRSAQTATQSGLEEAAAARDSAQAELAQVRGELEGSRGLLREAAVRYREARLASAPEIPHDLVPAGETLEEIDREFESAQRVVRRLRESMEEESRSARIPAGSPARRAPDLSGLSPSDKIKVGLQDRERR